jgi:hypothetical protein
MFQLAWGRVFLRVLPVPDCSFGGLHTMFKITRLVLVAVLPCLLAAPVYAAEDGDGGTAGSDFVPVKLGELAAKAKEATDAALKAKKAELDKELEAFRKEYPESDKQFPKRTAVVMPKGEVFRTWSLRAEDFKFDLPVQVFVEGVIGSKRLPGNDKVFMVLPFTVTNNMIDVDVYEEKNGKDILVAGFSACSPEEVKAISKRELGAGGKRTIKTKPANARLSLRFSMVTNKGVFLPEASGFVARQRVDYSSFKDRDWARDMISYLKENGERAGELKPGETRSGVAVFPRFDPSVTHISILIEGMTNDFDFEKDKRRIMILEFVRPGNIYYPGQVRMKFKRRIGGKLMDPKSGYLSKRDVKCHHGYDWLWLWNWDSAVKVETPKLSEGVVSPTGKQKENFWSYKVLLPNRTGAKQVFSVSKVATMATVTLTVGKDKLKREITVEVPLVDNGKMDVYKAGYLESVGETELPTNRFPAKLNVHPGEDPVSFQVIFRDTDVDFASVLKQIDNFFAVELAKGRAKAGKDKQAYFKRARQLSAAEVGSIRDQLAKKVPEALKAQMPKRVKAEISATSGFASGTRYINCSSVPPKTVNE